MRGHTASAEGEFVLISANWPLRCGIRSVLASAFPDTRIHEIDGLGAVPKVWPGAAPSLVFLDCDAPTLAPATLRLLRARLGAPVVVLIDEHSDAALMSLRGGAQGCIPRDFHGGSLIAAVRAPLLPGDPSGRPPDDLGTIAARSAKSGLRRRPDAPTDRRPDSAD